jgi:hypothetical protein
MKASRQTNPKMVAVDEQFVRRLTELLHGCVRNQHMPALSHNRLMQLPVLERSGESSCTKNRVANLKLQLTHTTVDCLFSELLVRI